MGSKRRFAPRGAGAWAVLARSGLLPAPPPHPLGSAHRVVDEVSVSQQLARRVTVTSCTIRKAVNFSTIARRQRINWSGLPCEARFWDWKLGPAKTYYL